MAFLSVSYLSTNELNELRVKLLCQISSVEDRVLQAVLYSLCITFLASVAYDMSYAFLKIIEGEADMLYASIFVILTFTQLIFFCAMVCAVKQRSQKVALYLGQYLLFAPIFFGGLYVLTGEDDVFLLLVYLLPMFHRVANDLLILFSHEIFVFNLDKYLWTAFVMMYGFSFMSASKKYSKLKDK